MPYETIPEGTPVNESHEAETDKNDENDIEEPY